MYLSPNWADAGGGTKFDSCCNVEIMSTDFYMPNSTDTAGYGSIFLLIETSAGSYRFYICTMGRTF